MKQFNALLLILSLFFFECFSVEKQTKEKSPQLIPIEDITSHFDRFLSPGIITINNDKWIGSDHLFNLTNTIDVIVEIIAPDGSKLPFDAETIQDHIVNEFSEYGLYPSKSRSGKELPLPFFHFFILAQPIERGYSACCSGRLFEQVTLDRVILEKDTYLQAITWERQNLIVSPIQNFKEKILENASSIAKEFLKSYQYYERLKSEKY